MKHFENFTIIKRTVFTLGILLHLILNVIVLFFFYSKYISPIESIAPVYTYELGSDIPDDVRLYATGNEWALDITTVDLSKVDAYTAGTYDAVMERAFQTVPFQIEIVDTLAPELSLKTERLYLQVDTEYTPEFFVDLVCDLSGHADLELSFYNQTGYGPSLSTSYCGYHTIFVRATDPSGNITTKCVSVYSDTPPEIHILKDIYAATDFYIDFENNVSVYDDYDGTENISLDINKSLVTTDTPGTYDVIYTATDSFGFSTEVRYPVYLYDRAELQALINTGQINRFDQKIVGAYNLYDGGSLQEPDTDAVMDHFLPAFVRIYYPGLSYGSGFIIQISDTDIIICTNHHVVKSDKEFDVYFHDGFSAKGEIVGRMDGVDVAFVRVPIEYIPANTFDTLKTVHINKAYVDAIKVPSDIKICFRTINNKGSVWRDRNGILLALYTNVDEEATRTYPKYYSNVDYVSVISPNVYGGSSGSAVLDEYGNLIGMVSFNRSVADEWGYKNFCITLEDILKSYKYFFNKDVNYQ